MGGNYDRLAMAYDCWAVHDRSIVLPRMAGGGKRQVWSQWIWRLVHMVRLPVQEVRLHEVLQAMNLGLIFLLTLINWNAAHGQEQIEQRGRAIWAEITSYCPCNICCAGTADGVTADGTRVSREPYGLAADPLLLPYGTMVYIPLGHNVLDRVRVDNRWLRIDDTGGSVVTEGREKGIIRLDLRVKEHWWAKQFGRKTMIVYLASPR